MTEERTCIRGCVQRDVHYATCSRSGPGYEGDNPCKGCAPKPCRDGSLICDTCFGRMRGLLGDVRDLVGRLTAIADPLKAAVLDQVRVRASTTEPPAVVGSDILDALVTLNAVHDWAYADLAQHTNDRETVAWLVEHVLERHRPVDGIRDAWSVQDVKDQWGVERQSDDVYVFPEEEDGEIVTNVPEWRDRLLTKREAEIEAGSARTLRRWVQQGRIEPEGRLRDGNRMTPWYRWSKIVQIREEMKANIREHQFAE